MQDSVQEINYIKLIFAMAVVCTAAVVVVASFVGYLAAFVGFPFGQLEPVDEQERAQLEEEIAQLDSVLAFKERYPQYREYVENRRDVLYTIQSRNENTGNILSLNVRYHNAQIGEYNRIESLSCIPSESIIVKGSVEFPHIFPDAVDLFIVETIQNTHCLDDDYVNKIVIIDPE